MREAGLLHGFNWVVMPERKLQAPASLRGQRAGLAS